MNTSSSFANCGYWVEFNRDPGGIKPLPALGTYDPSAKYDTRKRSPTFKNEQDRLSTFDDWETLELTTDKHLLARTGLYFLKRIDIVKCFFCKQGMELYQPYDNPLLEHLRMSPACPLLRGKNTSNVPIDAEAFKRSLPTITWKNLRQPTSGEPEISINRPNASNIRDLSPASTSSSNHEVDFSKGCFGHSIM